MKITTTFNKLKLAGACGQRRGSNQGYDKLATYLGGVENYGKDTPISLAVIARSNGLDDALWCLGTTCEDMETVVLPFVHRLTADYLEHLALADLPQAIRDLLEEGVALLRKSDVTLEELGAFEDKAAAAARAAAVARAAVGAAVGAVVGAAQAAEVARAAGVARAAEWAARAAEVARAAGVARAAVGAAQAAWTRQVARAAEWAARAAGIAAWTTQATRATQAYVWAARAAGIAWTTERKWQTTHFIESLEG